MFFYCRWVYNLLAIIYMLLCGSQQFFCLWSSYASPHKNGSQLEFLGLSFWPSQAGRYYFQLFFSLAFLTPCSILWFVLAELRLPMFIVCWFFSFCYYSRYHQFPAEDRIVAAATESILYPVVLNSKLTLWARYIWQISQALSSVMIH